MILLCGIPSEQPLALVAEALEQLGVPYIYFNQRQFSKMDMAFEIKGGAVSGTLTTPDSEYDLESFSGVYTRLMDEQFMPELLFEPPDSPLRQKARRLHATLMEWYEVAPCRVLNRTAPMASNFSKPYQAQWIRRYGFDIPETVITNDPSVVREFWKAYPAVIYKSISGVRSIVQQLTAEDLERLDSIRWCPTQFQAFVEGVNVRVHVVGKEVFATAIESEATDYRYAWSQIGAHAELSAIELSATWAERCVQLTRALELPFAGIDLKFTPNGRVYCFEVNPSPAFSYYECHTGQPIAWSVARHLAGIRD